MASRAAFQGVAVGLMAVGGTLMWSGVKGQTIATTVNGLVRGQVPQKEDPAYSAATSQQTAQAATIAGNAATIGKATGINQAPPTSGTVAALQAYARLMLAKHGWGGQFPAFNSIVDAESSWNPRAVNPSGAFGIAQSLGHGTAATQGTLTNAYGNYGTTDAICKAANSGNGNAQIEWMLNYIGEQYGDPNKAWAFHQVHGWY